MTDPKGRVFISYRRNRIDETNALAVALRDRGIPIWRDVSNLQHEPTEEAIRAALEDPKTSGAVLWISPDVIDSNIIKYVEVPLAVERYRRGDGFWLIIALVGGADYEHLSEIFYGALGTEDLRNWNVTKIRTLKVTSDEILAQARVGLDRRLEAITRILRDGDPAHIAVYAKGTFVPDLTRCLSIDWTFYFAGASPSQEHWETIRNAWHDVTRSIKTGLPPAKAVLLTGTPSLPTAVLMGSGFSLRDGKVASWIQRMPDGVNFEQWTHTDASSAQIARNLGWTTSIQHHSANNEAVAVLLNANDDTNLAVGRSRNSMPGWRAVLTINRPEGRNTRELPLSAAEVASVVHMTVDAIRHARQSTQPINSIHFFIAAPAGLGVLLGAQLATLPPITTYEFDTVVQRYVRAVRITT